VWPGLCESRWPGLYGVPVVHLLSAEFGAYQGWRLFRLVPIRKRMFRVYS